METPEIICIQTDRFEMEYFSFGRGNRPFVIIPGISMKPVMLSAGAIREAFDAFAENWTVYVFDRKKDIQPGYSVADMAEDTAEAMQCIGIAGADIFGASQGGMIAQTIALRHPELVHALYLGSTMARPGPMCREVMGKWLELADAGDAAALNHYVNTRIYSPEFYNAFADVFRRIEPDASPAEIARFRVLTEACLHFDIYARLGEIRCPVFVVGSRADMVLSGDASAEIAGKLGCPLYLYDGYSHAVYDEAPDYRGRMMEALLSLNG